MGDVTVNFNELTCGFIECTSLNFSYDVFGKVTVSYTVVHKNPTYCYTKTIFAGGKKFVGEVISMSLNEVPNTYGWYETHVTLVAVTE